MERRGPEKPKGDYPRYMLSMLGRNVLETFDLVASVLEEYEAIILEEDLSLAFILETMKVEGVLDELEETMDDLSEEVGKNIDKYSGKKAKAGYNPVKIQRQVYTALNEYFAAYIAHDSRPIMAALMASVFKKNVVIRETGFLADFTREPINWGYGAEIGLYQSSMASASGEEERKDIANRIGVYCLARKIQLEAWELTPEQEEEVAFGRILIDEMLEDFHYDRYERATIRFKANDSEEFANIFDEIVFQLYDHTNSICGIQFELPLGSNGNKVTVTFYLSRLNGELTFNDGLTPIKMVLEHYGQAYAYEWLRVQVLRTFHGLWREGAFSEYLITPTDEVIQEVQSGVAEVITPEVKEEEGEEELHNIEESPETTQEKDAYLGTIDHRTAIRTFERLGFSYEPGGRGRHPKIRRGRQILPFPHPHTKGSKGDISYLVKWLIKKAGLTRREFVDAIK